jgi:hypothetical protein
LLTSSTGEAAMRINLIAKGIALVVVASFISRDAEAQSIASRVAGARDGKVRFTFAAKPEICGYGNGISRVGSSSRSSWNSNESADVIYDEECSHSPVRMVLSVTGGKVTKVRTYVGGQWRSPSDPTVDIGAVSTREATNYLLSLAQSDDSRIGSEAILPIMLADSVNVYPPLFRLARDEARPQNTRRQALFWLGQAAADVVAPDRDSKGSDDEEIKKQAVFAISQRRRDESVPALIQVARNNRDAQVRRTALFWLGQTGDPRAVSLFEEILSR